MTTLDTVGRKRILLAPIPITPTKPLTPSHVKGMLWVDVMFKATSLLADVDCLYSHLTANGSEQTLGFWEYLDREHDDVDFESCDENDIGELYRRYHAQGSKVPYAALTSYLRAVERGTWCHPCSLRLCDIWAAQAASLGIENLMPARRPDTMAVDALVDLLKSGELCLDLRAAGGTLYLDATSEGLPLRRAITSDGQVNYLINLLRDLVPQIPHYDHIVLIHDEELNADHVLLQRILGKLGAVVHRVALSRVAIDGVVQSARFGGWRGYTASALIAHGLDAADLYSVRLGMRLYFIATLGKNRSASIDLKHLERSTRRAAVLLAQSQAGTSGDDVELFLRKHGGRECYVDPYRITTALLSRQHVPLGLIDGGNGWYM
ncbi:hypothetical protein [Bradyrhizobium sp. CB1015]|uniref:hypothetical protein n=1 Tax=Bradyrhizobium sp. CB1015 TaxID=2976822 RepID=UPI0021A9E4EA|nr:hypothetical protein [Bradyrhizobium sp. CB1015]UWU95726.1 hypothetical protein N2604_18370 [Bradyrhizobium sp. CB1015]